MAVVASWSCALWLAQAATGLAGAKAVRLPAANVAERCQWPTVVSFRAGEEKCTGTLVHPEVVVTAAHCILAGTPERMRFGEEFSPEARSMDVAECWARPEFAATEDPAEDIAACRLVAAVPDVPLTPLLGACETADAIVPGADVTLVGFGIPSTVGDFGTKRYAFTRVVEAPKDDGTFVAGDTMVNGCDGDSGGPALVRLADGTWHVAGVLVYGPECGAGPSRYLAASHQLEWLEEVTARDLTPCPDCRVATDPQVVADAWDAWCEGPQAMPEGGCVPPPDDLSTTGAADEGSTSDTADASSSTGVTPTPGEPPTSREGCRIAAPREHLGEFAFALWMLVGLAIGQAGPRQGAKPAADGSCRSKTRDGWSGAERAPRARR